MQACESPRVRLRRAPAARFAIAVAVVLGTAPGTPAQDPAAPAAATAAVPAGDPWVVYEGHDGPGRGKHIVFVTGDEEYRSEEGMPQLARILAARHGFTCTVLFAIDPESGEISPKTQDNIPGLEALNGADLMVIFTRFRDLPDEQMKHVVDYVESGRPIVGLRTATHAFHPRKHETYRRYGFRDREWDGGFGRQILGETWIAHHGGHGTQSSRGVPAPGMEHHPILRGIAPKTIWDPSDVYRVRLPMLEGIEPLLLGQVLDGMSPDDEPAPGREDPNTGEVKGNNHPMMPVAWFKTYTAPRASDGGERAAADAAVAAAGDPPAGGEIAVGGDTAVGRVFATTLGAARAFTQVGTRRLLVNACYWALGMEDRIPEKSDVRIVGEFEPSRFGFDRHKKGVKPADLRM